MAGRRVPMSERMVASPRECRLRPEFAALYPSLEPGVWEDAAVLAHQLLTEHALRPSPGFMLSNRMLPEAHFVFRGGDRAGRPRIARTRQSDAAM
jgi:hypothetical protein